MRNRSCPAAVYENDRRHKAVGRTSWEATANDTLQLVNFFEATNTSYEVNTRAGS